MSQRSKSPLAAVVLAACTFPSPGGFPCEGNGECGDGLVCMERVCVPAPRSCVAAVSTRFEHTCAVRDDHTVWCWGRNDAGQLGDGTTEDRPTPVQVPALPPVTAVAPGELHTCALASDKSVWCWGSSELGQLGGAVSSKQPIAVPGVTAQAIASGRNHSCALLDDATVKCWGNNGFGQIGNNREMTSSPPDLARISDGPLRNIESIAAAADVTCAINRDGQLWCWGHNDADMLGDGPSAILAPRQVPFAQPVAQVAFGEAFLCALTRDQGGGGPPAVYCLGDDSYEQLGSGGSSSAPVPISLPFTPGALIAGLRFACATEASDGGHDQQRLWCWGEDDDLQLADGRERNHGSPIVTAYAHVTAAAGGRTHLCALSDGGAIACSGFNGRGQLGDGSRTVQGSPPPPIAGVRGATSIAAGGGHSCAVVDGSVLCWGRNDVGQLGIGTLDDTARPTRVEGIQGATMVAAGAQHTCALVDGGALCWGNNFVGQVGDHVGDISSVPRRVLNDDDGTPLAGIVQLAVGGDHSCALLAGGGLKCWGANGNNEIGVHAGTCGSFGCSRAVTVDTEGRHLQEIALGDAHTCATNLEPVPPAGERRVVYCWGRNVNAQLGDNTTINRPEPMPVLGLDGLDIEHINAQGEFSCATATDGMVRCWGAGGAGQLGDGGSSQNRRIAGPTVASVTGARKLRGGDAHACVLADAGLQCWGLGSLGQLGDGGYVARETPVAVSLPAGAKVRDLAGGALHTCALLDDGTVTCWGDGRAGQLGNGMFDRRTPVAPQLPCP
ncbi:MAG TPA: hypothetical protein VFD36_13515 [Kofleriaceae bacterium]|nr:hypothetical protein [Kofleriaceae bacterium]